MGQLEFVPGFFFQIRNSPQILAGAPLLADSISMAAAMPPYSVLKLKIFI
jgi:hypothetical protein